MGWVWVKLKGCRFNNVGGTTEEVEQVPIVLNRCADWELWRCIECRLGAVTDVVAVAFRAIEARFEPSHIGKDSFVYGVDVASGLAFAVLDAARE